METILWLAITNLLAAFLSLAAFEVIFPAAWRAGKDAWLVLRVRIICVAVGLAVAILIVNDLAPRVGLISRPDTSGVALVGGAAEVVKYEPNPTVLGGTLTLRDGSGERKVVIGGDAERRTQVISSQRDAFVRPGAKRSEIRMWYWEVDPADGRMVVIQPS